jgi:UDP-N-acetylmuramoylalanine--D-glutamate ligase
MTEIGVLGLGRFGGGLGLARHLLRQGHRLRLFDLLSAGALEKELRALGPWKKSWTFISGKHDLKDFEGLDCVYLNPALPWQGTLAQALRNRGLRLSSDIELFLSTWTKDVIAVTGSNGKSTCWEMLRALLPNWAAGGNRGISVFDMKTEEAPGAILELSSFQLERLRHRFPLAIVTTFTEDHLDHHGGLENYRLAKENIFRFQEKKDLCLFGRGLEKWRGPGQNRYLPETVEFFSGKGISFSLKEFPLSGRHHRELLFLALEAAGEILDVAKLKDRYEAVCRKGFNALSHRQEILFRSPCLVVDDSKATTPASTLCALENFAKPEACVHLILGGKDKGFDLQAFGEALKAFPVRLYLIGSCGSSWQSVFSKQKLSSHLCGDMEKALDLILKSCHGEDVVLLSPGTASLDQYVNYAERGRHFKDLLKAGGFD